MSSRVVVIIFVAIFAVSEAHETTSLIGRTHLGLEKALNFVLDDYQQINLDCLYGVVLAHGFLVNILQMKLSKHDFNVISSYKNKIEEIVGLVEPLLLGDDTANNIFVENLIDTKRWYRDVVFQENLIDPNFRPINLITSKEDYLKFESLTNFNEHRSDECIMDIVTSGSYEVPHNCTVNKWCMKNMINKKKLEPAYVVTHRLLLLQIARSQNCVINKNLYNSKIRSYCSYIFWEVRQNQKFGYFHTLDDLLMEQITLCGAEGFGEFVTKELIEYILGIETEHGCFQVALIMRPKRTKRTANYIKHGCNDHSTGLGISTLSLFLLSLYQRGEKL